MLQGNSWRLGRIGGVEVRIDPSWSVIALLVGYTFFVVLANRFPTSTTATSIVIAVLMALAFFGSVLFHELAHSWMALARGVDVKGITLFLFGGATHADLETGEPQDELLISIVGPLSSLGIGGGFWVLSIALGSTSLGFATGYLGWVNLALAVFNLLPGLPLDGGRVLRSLVWRSTGDLLRATRIAARGGKALAAGVIAVGVLEVFLLGALINGLWLMAIGWFLLQAATASFTHLQIKAALADVPASRLMTSSLQEMPAGITVRRAVEDYFMQHNYNTFPVVSDHQTQGLVTMRSIRDVPQEAWDDTLVDDIAEPLSEMCTVRPSDTVGDVVGKLMQGDVGRVVVMADGEVVGLITPRDLARWLERSQELGDIERRLSLS